MKLNLPVRVGVADAADCRAEKRRRRSRNRAAVIAVAPVNVSMIENIKNFGAKFKLRFFAERKRFLREQISRICRRAAPRIAF